MLLKPTRRFATNARAPSDVTATANGSRPAAGRANSLSGAREITETSSDIELATMRRSPAAVRQNATAVGPMPTGSDPVSFSDFGVQQGQPIRLPARDEQLLAARIQGQSERSTRDLGPAQHLASGNIRFRHFVTVVQRNIESLAVMADCQAGGRIVMGPRLGPEQPVSGHEMAVETGCLGQRLLTDPSAYVAIAAIVMAQESDCDRSPPGCPLG